MKDILRGHGQTKDRKAVLSYFEKLNPAQQCLGLEENWSQTIVVTVIILPGYLVEYPTNPNPMKTCWLVTENISVLQLRVKLFFLTNPLLRLQLDFHYLTFASSVIIHLLEGPD